jgi:hypothetical protein
MNPSLRVALPALLVGMVTGTQAATTLIDNSTLNGSFESGTGTATVTSWSSAPGQTLQRQNTLTHADGSWSLVLGRSNVGTLLGAAINTGYSISTGDSFELSFSVRGAFQAETTDRAMWTLFYTSDNTLSGTATELFSGSMAVGGATYASTGLLGTGAVGAAADGKTLFLSLTPNTSDFTNDEFARADQVFLSVTSVPEPSLPVMAGLAAITLSVIRRRR